MCRFSRRDNMERKNIRLRDFDYSHNGAYFVTICTKNKEKIFWQNPYKEDLNLPEGYELSEYGIIAKEGIINISNIYNVDIINYVVMPNHIHILMLVDNAKGNKQSSINKIIQQYKGYVTKKIGFSPWQKLFYDHIVRDERDLMKIYEYIQYNPLKWNSDEYY